MNRYTLSCLHLRFPRKSIIAALLFLICCFFYGRTVHAIISTDPSDMVQFTASGHILGFESKGIYVASGDHVLRVEFEGTDGAKPIADRISKNDGHAQPLGRVQYPEVWPGISVSYEGISGGIAQSSYLLEPGADVGKIRLRYNASVEIEEGGNLRIEYENGWMNESAPVAWQEIEGRRIPVTVAFTLYDSSIKDSLVGFSLGQYNPSYPLMIDPTLSWNTFMGPGYAYAIALDGSGNVYVAGYSGAWGSPVNAHSGLSDAFVAKLNGSGVLQWNTFMGSAASDEAHAIALDGSGNVYVAGHSRGTWGSPVNAYTGDYDGFAAKLNSSGVLQWNTFMGSIAWDDAHAIALDGSGNVYVAGASRAAWGLAGSSPVSPYVGGYSDGFAAKLNSSGVLQWHTFMGSAASFNSDSVHAIAVDGSGSVYLAGGSGDTWGSPVNAHSGFGDAFAAKLNSSGVRQWHTFMGPAWAAAIALDGGGNIYVAGESGATWGSPVNVHSGSGDGFAAKLNSNGVLQWHTFMGSAVWDEASGIALDSIGNVYVAGWSLGTWASPVNAYMGSSDAFAAKLNSSGELQWNTFMGSPDWDGARAIAVDGSGNVYVTGQSEDTWGSPVNAHSGLSDAFVARLSAIDLDADGISDFDDNCPCTYNPEQEDVDGDGCGDACDGRPDDPNWVSTYGSITYNGASVCAMVLANGQYMFTCGDNLGLYDLDVPLDENGEITLYGFCSGKAPFKTVLSPTQALCYDIAMVSAAASSAEMNVEYQTESGTVNPDYTRIWGTVTYNGQDLCAMVLANGQNMFSCGNNLGTFDLEVPLDGNGEITLYVFCSGMAPYKYVFAP